MKMPVGPYATFGECVSAQQKKGKSKEAAGAICGAIEKKTKHKKELEDEIYKLQEELLNERLAKLTTKKRKDLPKASFAIPEKRAYPIHDRAHAANALARVSQHGTPEEKRRVRAAVCRRYPDMPACKKEKAENEVILISMEAGVEMEDVKKILDEGMLKDDVKALLSSVMKRWANNGAKKADIDMFREAVWLYRSLDDEGKEKSDMM